MKLTLGLACALFCLTFVSSAQAQSGDFLAALVASCFRGAFPPVDLRAVCFVRAIVFVLKICSKLFLSDEKASRGSLLRHLRQILNI